MDDRGIIDLFFERSEKAVTELAGKYGGFCRKIAGNLLGNREDAEECVNDVYLAVWSSIPPARPRCLSAYLGKIVRNKAIDRHRKNTAAFRNSEYDISLDELSECLPARCSVEDDFDAMALSKAVNGFLSTLDKNNRIVFMMRFWGGYSVGDIAAELKTTPNAVSAKLLRIKNRLKTYLAKEGFCDK